MHVMTFFPAPGLGRDAQPGLASRRTSACALAVALALAGGLPPPLQAEVLSIAGNCVSSGPDSGPVGRQPAPNTTAGPVDGSGTFSLVAGCNADGGHGFAVTAYGTRAVVTGKGGVATGYGTAATQWGVANGADSSASGIAAVAVGAGSLSSGRNAVAIGGAAGRDDVELLPALDSTLASGDGAVAIGANGTRGAQASATDSIALGGASRASGQQALALGAGASAEAANSVALGAGSSAGRGARQAYDAAFVGSQDASGEVNVGQRQLTGVAAGSEADDAVNVSQLRAGFEQSLQASRRYADEGVTDAKAHADKGVADARAHADAGVAGAKLHADQAAAAAVAHADRGLAVVGGEVDHLRRGVDGMFRVSQDDVTAARVTAAQATAGGAGAEATGARATALGHAAHASGEDSVALGAGSTAARDRTVAVGATGRERTLSHVADGIEGSDAATMRQLGQLRDGAVHYDRTDAGDVDYASVSLGRGEAVTMANVAPGSRADHAVNLSQLHASAAHTLDSAHAYADARIGEVREDLWQLSRRVDRMAHRMEAGIAAAMGLKQAPAVSGRTTYYIGGGTWRGQGAGGVSLRRTADNGRWSLEGGVSGNHSGMGGYVGISGVLGR